MFIGLVAGVGSLGGCSPDDGPAKDADAGVAPPVVVAPPDCNEPADAIAPEAKGCIVDAFALFVDDAAGDDTNEGTKAKPLKKIGSAIAKIGSTGKRRIYVCGSATYSEHLRLTTAANLHGGFACSSWTPDAGAKPKVAPSDKGYALRIDNVSAPVTVSDLELSAADMSELKDGASSIAVFANRANVTLLRAVIHALNGAEGTSGEPGGPGQITSVSSGSFDPTGNPASGANGGQRKECTCSSSPALSTVGGAGGSDTGGGAGEPSYATGGPNNGAPGILAVGGTCDASTRGKGGADAPAAANAMPPATRGAVDLRGWAPSDGVDATEGGKPGQGGGGGGAQDGSTGGGGGGCGGCGGSPGKGGGGGGGSIALLAHDSAVTLKASSLDTKSGGPGGVAGAGGVGSVGGEPGAGACLAGKGGKGADGASGSGGAGGVSIGVLFSGTAPVIDDATTIVVGGFGAKGKGGKSPDNDGPDGVAEKTKDASQL
jgi:hypothetical protein